MPGVGKSGDDGASTASQTQARREEISKAGKTTDAIWPGTSLWRGPDLERMEEYVPITRPNARGKPVQFLNFLLACSGHFPFEYLFAVTKEDLKDCINFLGAEYVENVLRTKGLECAFQNLQVDTFLLKRNLYTSIIFGLLISTGFVSQRYY